MRIEHMLAQNARRFGPRPLALHGDRSLSYAETDRQAARLANLLLGRGVQLGDRVLALLPSCLEYVPIMFAAARAGVTLVPLNPRLSPDEAETIWQHSQPQALIGRRAWLDWARDVGHADAILLALEDLEATLDGASSAAAPALEDDLQPWLLGYTSGTSGRPKGALLSHRAKSTSALVEIAEFGTSAADRALLNTPLFHVHALVHVLTLMAAGGSVRLADRFEPAETLRLVDSGEVTELSMVPTMYRAILDAKPCATSRVRLARCTGAATAPELLAELRERLPGWPVHVFYGATEAGAVSNLRPEHQASKPGSVGLPFLGVEVESREGEVWLRSPAQFSGYLGQAGPGYRDWFTLGDLGQVDEDGFLTLTGRASDTIVSGGEKIRPSEVEEVLQAHPAVRAAAVFGRPDPYWGEAVHAVVELEPGQSAAAEELLRVCAERLTPHKRPKSIQLVPALPRNVMGKIDKARLR